MTHSPFITREIAQSHRDVRAHEDEVVTPRCPCCRAWLIARVGKAGPYFMCNCPRRPAPAPALRRAA